MASRNIIEIDEEKCNGCGECVTSCAEGAIQIIDGKARLISEVYCDGLGACLGECPEDAIRMVERDAKAFDEAAVAQHLARQQQQQQQQPPAAAHGGCPGSRMQQFARPAAEPVNGSRPSQLANWPLQLHLVSPGAPYLEGADLLIAADCVPFAYADFHGKLLKGQPVLIGCPKLDDANAYVGKLATILETARPASLTVVHMEVPCCIGIAQIAKLAIMQTNSDLDLRIIVVGIRGNIVRDTAGELISTN